MASYEMATRQVQTASLWRDAWQSVEHSLPVRHQAGMIYEQRIRQAQETYGYLLD